jgi:predicted phosphodiesterase
MKEVKIGFFSDTHTLHKQWRKNFINFNKGDEIEKEWSELDILCFTGDCSSIGRSKEILDFMTWFNDQPAKEKVMISGNHDFFFDATYRSQKRRSSWETCPEDEVKEMLLTFPKIHYLNDSSVNLFGLNIWGSPVQPAFNNWAFNKNRNTIVKLNGDVEYYDKNIFNGIEDHWKLIPENVDILLSHGPPYGYNDSISSASVRLGENPKVGCADLRSAIQRVKPKIVAYGHIHEAYGTIEEDAITYINCSSLDEHYNPINNPIFKILTVKNE